MSLFSEIEADSDADRELALIAASDAEVIELSCVNCGSFFEHPKGTRGRKPSKCPDCRATRTSGDSDTMRPKGARRTNAKIATQTTKTLNQLGFIIMLRDAFDGNVIMESADEVGAYMAELAAKYPAVRKFIETTGDAGLIANGVILAASIAVPIAWHHIPAFQARVSLDVIKKFGGKVPDSLLIQPKAPVPSDAE